MQITIPTRLPAAKASQLTAVIDLGEARPLFLKATVKVHPAWADVQRRMRAGEIKSAFLAAGRAPLLYLPAAEAKAWDDDEKIRILAARAYDAAREREAAELVVVLDGPAGPDAAPLAAEGIALHAYQFIKYKKENGPKREPAVKLVAPVKAARDVKTRVDRTLARVDSINRARDLINEPASVVTPEEIERQAREVAKARGLKITVLDVKELEKQGYQGLLTVGRGAVVSPRMIILNYVPAKAEGGAGGGVKAHLGLLGKGITFDTGGISIKPSQLMWEMKSDMSGAAAVLFAMETIAVAAPPIRVTGVIVTAENAVDAKASLPGTIFRARNGKSIHVDNTDAEGRLILTDGLWRMGEEKVTHLVDAATLTGACIRALGPSISGILGNDDFADRVAEVAAAEGEPCWRLPLVEEYRKWLDIEHADINNIPASPGNQPYAGTITAALFLREFVPEGVHWAHVDIAGTAFMLGHWKYYRPGATGVMVRTFTALAERMGSGAIQ